MIDNTPTVEQPTGEWIECTKSGMPLTEYGRMMGEKWYGFKCSQCNFIYKGNALIESPYCQKCGAKMINTNTESEEKNMKEMTVTEYRERLIEAFQNTGNDNLIALVCLPNEEAFKALESLLRNFWNKKGGETNEVNFCWHCGARMKLNGGKSNDS